MQDMLQNAYVVRIMLEKLKETQQLLVKTQHSHITSQSQLNINTHLVQLLEWTILCHPPTIPSENIRSNINLTLQNNS